MRPWGAPVKELFATAAQNLGLEPQAWGQQVDATMCIPTISHLGPTPPKVSQAGPTLTFFVGVGGAKVHLGLARVVPGEFHWRKFTRPKKYFSS